MAKTIQAIRGMNDCLPNESPLWQKLESAVKKVISAYGYSEVRMPLLESTNLFCRAIGEVTDVVEKEMYTFNDRSGDSITLRPEGTASCVRVCLENGLIYNQEQRLWYIGPMFRYERPQKGRYRQFHQCGVEVFGLEGPNIDAELIIMTARLWKELGIDKHVRLELNSIGSLEARNTYRNALVAFLEQHVDLLDDDCKRRMYVNPLRVLDTKNPQITYLLNDAPKLSDYLDEASKEHLSDLCSLLDTAGVQYTINERLVRGLDYYNRTVFEWITDSLGAQGTVCGGGRYDGLVEQLGGKPTSAVGFAMGLERLVLMLETLSPAESRSAVDVYIIASGHNAFSKALCLSESLRDELPNLHIMSDCGDGSFKKQFKRADRAGALFALVLGEDELRDNTVVLKNLTTGEQWAVEQNLLAQKLAATLI